jgi:opacity protein-like surface antigen
VQQTPIPSREALRSLIEPEKLQQLDISSQAAGITDLNPNKEKLLKNLKQFAGYDINKGFHIGAFISINNVWLNNKDFSADENTTSIKPKVQFGKAYGINIGYDYTDRWGIQLEWQISEQGQKYSMQQQSEEERVTKNINLLYTKFPIMMKYKQTFINNYNSKPIALSFLFGPQFGILIKKQVTMNGVEMQNTPEYNKAEFGLMGGFDFDLFMTRNLAMTIGGRTGFATSFKKGQPMSFQLGVTTQFNFRFPKKIK